MSTEESTNGGRAVIPIGPGGVELRDIDAMFRFAKCYMQSGLTPPSFKNEQQLVICWAKAKELGLSPLQAVEGMSVVNNRIGIMGDLALAMVESSGLLEFKKVEYTGEGETLECKITLKRKGREAQTYSFSVREAKAAGIYERSAVWKQYSKRMTYYRALGFGLRDEFADVLKGVKTVEELTDYPSEEPRRVVRTIKPEPNRLFKRQEVIQKSDAVAREQTPLGRNEALVKIRAMLELLKIDEFELLAVIKDSKLREVQDAKSLRDISDHILNLVLADPENVKDLVEQLRARKAESIP
jgi:hypothetical protein